MAAIFPARGSPLAETTAVTRRFVYRPFQPLESLLEAVSQTRPEMIVPCDDRAVTHLHQLHAAATEMGEAGIWIKNLIEKSIGPPESFAVASSRFRLWQVAKAENVLVPEMKLLASLTDLDAWRRDRPLPWILKADGSWGGHGVTIVNTPEQAARAYRKMRRPVSALATLKRVVVNRDWFSRESWRANQRAAISVQDLIEGRPANCVAFCKHGHIISLIAVEVVAAQSITGPSTVVRVIRNDQMRMAASRIAARLNLSGFYGFDFMLEERTGDAFLIEMNPRSALPCHLRLGDGQDLIGALASEVDSQLAGIPADFASARAFAYFPQAWHTKVPNEVMERVQHDMPRNEPALLKELSRVPWPDRSPLARMLDRLRNQSFEDRAQESCVFAAAAAHLQDDEFDSPVSGADQLTRCVS